MPLLRRLLGLLALLLCAVPAAGSSAPAPVARRHPIPVLWMLPGPSGVGVADDSAGLTLAVRMALDDLERQQAPPLGEYRMQLRVIRAQCDLSSSLKSLFDAMWAGPKYPLLLGGACPSVAAQVAAALPAFGMVQVSYGDEVSRLSFGGRRYGNVFSAAPSGRAVNRAAVELLRRFGWTRVGLLAGEETSSDMSNDLTGRMTTSNVRIVSMATLPDRDCAGLLDMKERDVRVVVIVLAAADEDSLASVFCCWIVAGGDPRWRSGFAAAGCASDDIAAAADGAIWMPVTRVPRPDTPGVSGRTPGDFERAYLREVRRRPGVRASPRRAFAYDAVWAAAKALVGVTEALKRRQKFSRNANVSQEEAARALRDAVARTHFEGVTGTVSFQHGQRSSFLHVIQTQGSADVLVGDSDPKTGELRVSERLLKFKGSRAPKDVRRVAVLVYAALVAVAAVTAAVSLSALCAAAAVKRRADAGSSAWASEALLLMLAAIFLSTAAVIVVVVAAGLDDDFLAPETTGALCSVHSCLLVTSHSLASASLLAQTWRRLSQGTEVPSPFRLAAFVGSVDALLLLACQTMAPSGRAETTNGTQQSDSAHPDVITWMMSRRCSSSNTDAWTAAIYAYKVPLMACGCLLSCLLPDANGGACAWWARVCVACAWWASTWANAAPPSHISWLDFCALNAWLLACNVVVLAASFRGRLIDSGVDAGQPDAGGGTQENLNRQLKLQSVELDAQIHTISTRLCDVRDAEVGRRLTGSRDVTSHDITNGDVNSPELVRRRLSLQLPILHLSYLPAVGGVSASDSAHFASRDV
ncbi:gamma-aminobutyric acid type B receptor subunit 2-like isoform X2 [Festucalex cinctus]